MSAKDVLSTFEHTHLNLFFLMVNSYRKTLWLLISLGYTFVANAQTQLENNNWYFGNQAGISFATNSPAATMGSGMTSYEGSASVSNAVGQLLMYSNGEKVWDATHQVMPNGSNLGGHNSTSQGALILRAPGSNSLYYLFTVDAIDNNMVGGLRYSIIDMSLRGGLGDVTTTKSVRLPTPTLAGKVTEKLTAALHNNGRDYWVVVHGWQTNNFHSFLLSSTGISTTPVTSAVGPVHEGGGSFFGAGNAVGYMRVSPNGMKLALAERDRQYELYDFNNATGQVTNFISLPGASLMNYGVEFSPSSSLLYTASYSDGGYDTTISQFNLLAGSPSAIQASRQNIGYASGLSVAIQAASNGKLYLSALNQNYLNSIDQPNVLGTGCTFRVNSVSLGTKLGQNGLPNFPNATSTVLAVTSAQLSAATTLVPNPARAQVTLVLPAAMSKQVVDVDFINVLGQSVAHESRSAVGTSLTLSLAGLAKGVYTVRISGAAGVASKKLVVE